MKVRGGRVRAVFDTKRSFFAGGSRKPGLELRFGDEIDNAFAEDFKLCPGIGGQRLDSRFSVITRRPQADEAISIPSGLSCMK